jgi:ribonuclease HI
LFLGDLTRQSNISEPLAGPRQTNQRAELTAIKRALDMVPLDRDTTIHSDSAYSIKCATEWGPRWAAGGWVTAARKPVENRDLVEELLWRVRAREACGARTRFKWVKGHAEEEGNVQADRLAVQGAMASRAAGN